MLWFISVLVVLLEGLELFNEDFIKIPPEKMNKKNTSATKTTETVCGHCYAVLEEAVMSLAAKPMTNEHFSELHLKIFLW